MTALPTEKERRELVDEIKQIALEAGAVTLQYFQSDLNIETKDDQSPVTKADQEAEALILDRMDDLNLNRPIIAEESVVDGTIPAIENNEAFWLVDPLDGTKEFISGSGEYTINIALVTRREPLLGVVYTPVKDEMYAGWGDGTAQLTKSGHTGSISVRPFPDIGLTVVTSRRHGDPNRVRSFLKNRTIAEKITRGSSLKFCQLAAGRADIYPRFGPTYEWDIAAGDAVLRAAGGCTYTTGGSTMTYGKKNFWNAEFIAATSDAVFE